MDALRQDIRFAIRSLRHSPGTTIIAVLCLALGIGANTAIFSVVRAVLLDSLPYRAPEQLVTLNEAGRRGASSVSVAAYNDFKAQRSLFSDAAAWTYSSRDLGDVADPERLTGIRATTNLFSTLGAAPLVGRSFVDADEPVNGNLVVMLSEGLWRRRFGADRGVIGAPIMLSNRKYTIVGVMPASFDFPVGTAHNDFWEPLDTRDFGDITNRGNRSLHVIARLKPGVDSARAAAGLDALGRQLAIAYPVTNHDRGLMVRGTVAGVVGSVRPALLVLLAAVSLVLLIACANVANLTLVRAAGRRREVAIRTALGAERSRLARQLLTESALLALAGGALGIGVAWWSLHALLGVSANVLPRSDRVGIDGGILAFAAIVSILTGVGVGLVPAIRASAPDLRRDLSDAAGRSSVSGARHRTLKTLIAAEIALSVVLLTGAGLVIRSFIAIMNVDAGFAVDGVMTFNVGAPLASVPDTARYQLVYKPILDRLRSLPGVRAAGMTNVLPVSGGTTDRFFSVVGRAKPADNSTSPDAEHRVISPGYFHAFGVRMISGRDFTEDDTRQSPHVAVINDELARRYFPGENPLGRQIEYGNGPTTIVGVVRAVRETGLDQDLLAEFYDPAAQMSDGTRTMSFVVSATGDPSALASVVRREVHEVVPQQPIFGMSTMSGVLRQSLGTRRLLLMLLGLFAGLALVLSAAGVYGVMSYGVTQRRREIGIRIALGAGFGEVTGMVLRDVAGVAIAGIIAGVVASLALSRFMSSVLYGVPATDLLTFVAVPFVIGAVAIAAGAVPAVRAARVDPLIAMRTEA